MATSQYKHILQFSNNYTVTFEKGGGKVHCTIKEGDQQRATTSGELPDYKRMFDMVVGDIPYDEKPSPTKPGTGPSPQSSSKPFTGTAAADKKQADQDRADAAKAKTEASKK